MVDFHVCAASQEREHHERASRGDLKGGLVPQVEEADGSSWVVGHENARDHITSVVRIQVLGSLSQVDSLFVRGQDIQLRVPEFNRGLPAFVAG